MDIEEALNLIKSANPENPLPQDFADQLETTYLNDLELRDNAVRTTEAERDDWKQKYESETTRLKTENYELTRKLPSNMGEPKVEDDSGKPKQPATMEELANRWNWR